ncbi:hypothetical protein A5663_09630 [Mycobacterium sp. E740]|nr:hypothetical protein A5663_09630 [Mycobacterium sp. E740]
MPVVNPRLAAGVGVVSAFLLMSGAGVTTVAYAHPGDSRGSDKGNSSDRGGSHGRASNKANHDNGRRGEHRGNRGGAKANIDSTPSRVGSGRETSDVVDDSDTVRRSASAVASANRPSLADGPALDSEPVTDSGPIVTVPSSAPTTDFPAASGGTDAPTPEFAPPKATFGNGRAPIAQAGQPELPPPARPLESAEAPPPPPPAPVIPTPRTPTWVERVLAPPVTARQFVVAPGAQSTDPMWGIAGLLLIPAAGAVLGYRQARAARAAERMRQR